MIELRRQLDTTKSESMVGFDQLMKAMMELNTNISNQTTTRMDKMSVDTSNRMDKMLALVLGFIAAGAGYLSHEMDNKIKTGNTLLKEQLKKEMETGNALLKKEIKDEMKEVDRKIETGNAQLKEEMETGNAQLKEDLTKALKPSSFFGKLIY